MPVYEYRCTECLHEWEVSQRIRDVPEKYCPACRKPSAQRLISHTAFQLAGRGWAKDNYGLPR